MDSSLLLYRISADRSSEIKYWALYSQETSPLTIYSFIPDSLLAGIAQLADDAVLDLGLGEGSMYCCVKPSQIVGAGNENILYTSYTSVFQAIEDSCPELSTFIFSNPHPQDIFPAIQIDSNGNIHCFLHDLPFAADIIVDGVRNTTA